jgi:hypothetical protein
MTIAEIIAQQLGGRRFAMMTGAVFLQQDAGNTLVVRFKGSNKTNILEIKYNSKDLYDMTFRKLRGTKLKTIETHNDVYSDQLQQIFEATTGLYTKL